MLSLWIASGLFAIGLSYPIALATNLRASPADARRWIKNSPSFCIYAMVILPIGAGIVLPELLHFPDRSNLIQFFLSVAVLAIVFLISVLGVLSELGRPPSSEPAHGDRNQVEERLKVESENRETIRAALAELVTVEKSLKNAKSEEQSVELRNEIERINQQIDQAKRNVLEGKAALGNLKGLFQRGTFADFSALFVNLFCTLFAAGVVWQTFNTLAFHVDVDADRILLGLALLVMWFPFRAYSEWYINFYSFDSIKSYYSGIGLFVAAVVVFTMMSVYENPSLGVRAITGALGALFGFAMVAAKLQPAIFRAGARFLEGIPFTWWLAYVLLVLIGLVATVALLLVEPAAAALV